MHADLAALLYLIAGVLFILALRGLSSPETSRRGNLFGMIGMAIAIVTTLGLHPPAGAGAWALVVLGLAIGGSTGAVIARRVSMTAMPELVAAFHSLVGMAAATAANIHAPLTAAVMIFELSGDYAIVLPLILVTVVATAVSRALGSESLYQGELRKRGVTWELTLEGRRITPDDDSPPPNSPT